MQGTLQIETEDNNKRFEIDKDFRVDISRSPVTLEDVCEDTDAKDAKNLRLEGGETIMVTLRGIEDVGSILLVDKDLSDSSIALDKGSPDDSITVVRFECDSPREPPGACDNGQFEVEIPEDIDKVSIKSDQGQVMMLTIFWIFISVK